MPATWAVSSSGVAAAHGGDAELGQHVLEEEIGAAVHGLGVQHHVAGLEQGQQRGADGGHAAGEAGRVLGAVPEAEAVLQDFEAGVVEAGVDEAHFLVGVGLAQAVSQLKVGLALLGAAEDESRRLENGGLDGALAPGGGVAVAHHQTFGAQLLAADMGVFV
jgi:hypothetical protein